MEDKESMRKILMNNQKNDIRIEIVIQCGIIKEMTSDTISRNEIINTLSKIIESKCKENKVFLQKQEWEKDIEFIRVEILVLNELGRWENINKRKSEKTKTK